MCEKMVWTELKESVLAKQGLLSRRRALLGFDGYIDKVVRLEKSQCCPRQYFETIREFTDHLIDQGCASADIALDRVAVKVGGNGTLMAESIAAKGVSTACIGAMGYPNLNPVYLPMEGKCRLFSVEDPAESLAMEFQDGKLMFGDTIPLGRIDWNCIRSRIQGTVLSDLFEQSDLVGFCNWSGLIHSNDILAGMVREICPVLTKRERLLFIDLADPSAKEEGDFQQLFRVTDQLRKYYHVILGLNPKEGLIVYNRYFRKSEHALNMTMEEELRISLPVDEIVIHGLDYADAGSKRTELCRVPGRLEKHPKILTGGGDNFNAGYCIGKLMDLPPAFCLALGNLSSFAYIANGCPADIGTLVGLLDSKEYSITADGKEIIRNEHL